MTNDELAKTVDTSDEWIASGPGSGNATLPSRTRPRLHGRTRCRRAALDHAGATCGDVDAIILATSTPDQAFPATALGVQAALGCGGFGFDVSAACSGFIYGLASPTR